MLRYVAAGAAAGCARFVYQAICDPILVVWDLDATLISSHLLPDAERFPRRECFDQYDDDFPPGEAGAPNTRTFHRPWAARTLAVLDCFAKQHVMTAAQRTYTENVLAHIDPRRKRFERVLTRDDAWAGGQAPPSKDLLHIVAEAKLRRTVFFDDRLRNFTPQPRNGICVQPFEDPTQPDRECLRMICICVLCTLASDVRPVLRLFQSKAYQQKHGLDT